MTDKPTMNTLRIVHEDARLIVVDKPAGQLVIPGRGEAQGEPLVDRVASHIGGKAFVVHRIDRETSGLVVFAKDGATHKALNGLWEKKEVRKVYLAWVKGPLDQPDGLLDYPLKTFGSGRIGVSPGGKPSQTRFKTLQLRGGETLLEIELLTGRRHQIRVHLYHIGHPVLGDPLYGQERPVGGYPRLMLHSYRLELPLDDGPLKLSAEPPADFKIP